MYAGLSVLGCGHFYLEVGEEVCVDGVVGVACQYGDVVVGVFSGGSEEYVGGGLADEEGLPVFIDGVGVVPACFDEGGHVHEYNDVFESGEGFG